MSLFLAKIRLCERSRDVLSTFFAMLFSRNNLFAVRSFTVAKRTTVRYAFLLLGLLFTYPLISNIFWRDTGIGTALDALFFCCYLCFGFTLQLLLPRFRWVVWSVLLLSALFVAPQALFPPAFESHSARLWCLRATLACSVFLLRETRLRRRGPQQTPEAEHLAV